MIAAGSLLLWTLAFAPAPPPTPVPEPAALERALAALPARPSIAEVQQAVVQRLALGPRAARRLLARARAAALPSVQGEYDQTIDRDYQLDQAAGTADALTQDLGAGRGARVRATWDLGRLVFNPDELRAARAILDAAAERERILVAVTQLYFERQQLLLEIALLPARDGKEAIGRRVRVAEIEAVLTGLTGLRF
ncbi:hypothetical protein OV079_13710 [Nannocystis pusilla]|uniref:TolC family protein n=1 Tax=Nannocystis pusilla TaxID=889268 RepID=A0A9X3EMP7_9BACT|nr:hypothetical protein [Nannocystis pusilla]MCY1006590.1 hypothetical protein [Nannocystis pusilla]